MSDASLQDRTRTTRQYVLVLVALAAGSMLAWWATSATWAITEMSVLGDADGAMSLAVTTSALSASSIAPVAAAMPIVGFAGLAGVIGSKGVVRRIIGALLVVAGVVLAWAGGQAAMSLQVGDTIGREGAEIVEVASRFPWLAALSGVVLIVGSVAVMARGQRWPSLGSKYERSPRQPRDAWESLDRGIDPTAD
jgi:hypothetical protein